MLGHYSVHSGPWGMLLGMVKRIALDDEDAMDKHCLGEGKFQSQTGTSWHLHSLFRPEQIGEGNTNSKPEQVEPLSLFRRIHVGDGSLEFQIRMVQGSDCVIIWLELSAIDCSSALSQDYTVLVLEHTVKGLWACACIGMVIHRGNFSLT